MLVGPQEAPGSERAKPLGDDNVAVEFRPPAGLKPAQLGVILDERVDNHDISATIVDLAVRGHLTIEQREEKKFIWFSQSEWVLHYRENPQDELEGYERLLYNALFASGPEVHLSELTGSFASEYQRVQNALYSDAQQRRWFARRPDKVRDTYAVIGFLGTGLSIGAVVLAAMYTHFALIPLALVPVALAFWALHRYMPRRTPLGSDLLRRTLGFREFIVTAETGRMQFAEEENIFAKYLPYAVMFAAVDKWARAFADLATGPTVTSNPYGYVPYPWYIGGIGGGGFDLPSFSAALSDFSSRAGSSLSTRPASTGSSGFGGGGFSGGGMGGGGGGSW